MVYSEKFVEWMDVPQNFNPQTRFKPDARCYNLNAPTSACCDRNELPLPATPLTPFEILNVSWSDSISCQYGFMMSYHQYLNQIHVKSYWCHITKWRHFLQWYDMFPPWWFFGEFQWLFPLDPWIKTASGLDMAIGSMREKEEALIRLSASYAPKNRRLLRDRKNTEDVGYFYGSYMGYTRYTTKKWRFFRRENDDESLGWGIPDFQTTTLGGREVSADVQCGDVDLALHGDEDVVETSSTLSGIIRYLMLSLVSWVSYLLIVDRWHLYVQFISIHSIRFQFSQQKKSAEWFSVGSRRMSPMSPFSWSFSSCPAIWIIPGWDETLRASPEKWWRWIPHIPH